MKLRKITAAEKPNYPAFADYLLNRDRYLKGLSIGAGALLAAGAMALAGATDERQVPATANGVSADNVPIRVIEKGRGGRVGRTPITPQSAPPVAIDGDMVCPAPPGKPATLGEPAAGKPVPSAEKPVQVRGEIMVPKPPDKPPKTLGTPPPPPPAGGITAPEPPKDPKGTKDPKKDDPAKVKPEGPKQGETTPVKPEDPPRTLGKLVAPQRPQVEGLMVAPEPPPREK